jgi:hypothetical protein
LSTVRSTGFTRSRLVDGAWSLVMLHFYTQHL